MTSDTVLLYITAPDMGCARDLGRSAVESGLAACANILPGMASIYRWQGALEEAEEVVLILKTRAEQAQALQDRIIALHPYDTPCVLVLPIAAGNPDFLAWIAEQTGGQAR